MNVLFWGSDDNAPVPYFRGGQFVTHFAAHGITARYVPVAKLTLDLLEWADAVQFRRWYARTIGGVIMSDALTAKAWEVCGEKGIGRVFDTDDDDFMPRPTFPSEKYLAAPGVRDLMARMIREADIVTVSVPELATRRYGTGRRVVVVRNAVDMPRYKPTVPKPDRRTTVLMYGSVVRLRDYFGKPVNGKWEGGHAYAAVKAAGLYSIWLGDTGEGPQPVEFDEILPYQRSLRRAFEAMANTHADIGVAPLTGDAYDYCKSELHWLDLSAAGIPVVAQRLMGGGPYAVIRSGTDGLLVRGRREWEEAIKRLAANPALRADLVAAAQERLRADYDPARRAGEWADVFRASVA